MINILEGPNKKPNEGKDIKIPIDFDLDIEYESTGGSFDVGPIKKIKKIIKTKSTGIKKKNKPGLF